MAHIKRTRKAYIEYYTSFPLYKLEDIIYFINQKIKALIKQSEVGSKRYQHLRHKRNTIRQIILDKLLKWSKDPDNKPIDDETFAAIVDNENSEYYNIET